MGICSKMLTKPRRLLVARILDTFPRLRSTWFFRRTDLSRHWEVRPTANLLYRLYDKFRNIIVALNIDRRWQVMLTFIRTCPMLSRSLRVALCGVFSVSKSIVIPNGIAISSVRAYRRPILPDESSTLCETSTLVRSWAVKHFFPGNGKY